MLAHPLDLSALGFQYPVASGARSSAGYWQKVHVFYQGGQCPLGWTSLSLWHPVGSKLTEPAVHPHKSAEGHQMCLVATAFSFHCPFPFAPRAGHCGSGLPYHTHLSRRVLCIRIFHSKHLLRLQESSSPTPPGRPPSPMQWWGDAAALGRWCSGWDCFPCIRVHECSVSCRCGEALGHVRGWLTRRGASNLHHSDADE